MNIDILGISELKWTRMGEFNSDDHYIYYCGHESLRRNGVAPIVNERVWNAVNVKSLSVSDSLRHHVHGKTWGLNTSSGKNTGVGCHFLLQGIFPDPGIKPRSPALQANALTSEPPNQHGITLNNVISQLCFI